MPQPMCPTCSKNPGIMHRTYGNTACQPCLDKANGEPARNSSTPLVGDLSSKGKRLKHWQEIKSRITTHEGEMLTGSKGKQYQQKWGQRLLGIQPQVNWDAPQYQRELDKRR